MDPEPIIPPDFKHPDVALVYNELNITDQIKNIILIHDQVGNYNEFVDGCNAFTFPIVYNYRSTKSELTEVLRKFNTINRIAVVCHGSESPLFLGVDQLFSESNTNFFIDISKKITNLDFLACNTLQYDTWNSFYDALKKDTNVIIGASNDATGNLKYGGDWIMESTKENIQTIYFTDKIENYQDTLNTYKDDNTPLYFTIANDNATITRHSSYVNMNTIQINKTVTNNGKSYNVTAIAESAFIDSKITSITFASDNVISSIGSTAFYLCKFLESFEIPPNVKAIEMFTFWNCSNLKRIIFPPNFIRIDQQSFCGCAFTSFIIPSSVLVLGDYIFGGCINLKWILNRSYIGSSYFNPTLQQIPKVIIERDGYSLIKNKGIPLQDLLNANGKYLDLGGFTGTWFDTWVKEQLLTLDNTITADDLLVKHMFPANLIEQLFFNYHISNSLLSQNFSTTGFTLINNNENITLLNPIYFFSSQSTLRVDTKGRLYFNSGGYYIDLLYQDTVPEYDVYYKSDTILKTSTIIFNKTGTQIKITFNSVDNKYTSNDFIIHFKCSSFSASNTALFGIKSTGVQKSYTDLINIGIVQQSFTMTISDNNLSDRGVVFTKRLRCFKEGTKILCANEEYIPVEQLKPGDLVKTYKHGLRRITKVTTAKMVNNPDNFGKCLYLMKKTDIMTDDLFLTGWHSIMVDDLGDSEADNTKRLGPNNKIDDKYLLLCSVSHEFNKVDNTQEYTVYNFALDGDGDDEARYGVYANGVLCETPSTAMLH